MAEEIERRGDRTPQRQAPEKRQPLFGHAHSFGVAAEVDRYRSQQASANGQRPLPAAGSHHPKRDAVLDHLLNPLSRRGKGPSNTWHRFKCRCGHHEMQGGHLMQVSGNTVFVPRRCRWCDTASCA